MNEKIDENIYAAGCYNGSGIGVGTFFGEQIALMASNQDSKEISIIQEIKKPNLLPPQPLLNIGIYSRLFLTLGQLESYSLLWTPLDTLGTHLLGTQGEGWVIEPRPLGSYYIPSHILFLVSEVLSQNNIMLFNQKTQPQPETDGGTVRCIRPSPTVI